MKLFKKAISIALIFTLAVTSMSVLCSDVSAVNLTYQKRGRNIIIDLDNSYLIGSITPENLSRWINHLDNAYDAYYDLIGKKPVDGSKITIKASDDNYGWAWVYGNGKDPTIYWNQDYIRSELKVINDTDTWSFGILHELGHLFDIDGRWNFDAEFWANTKMIYVLETLNASVIMNNKVRTGAEIAQYYYSESLYGSYINTLGKSNPTYSSDGLTYMFIEMKNNIGWDAFKYAFRGFFYGGNVPSTKEGKFDLFMKYLGTVGNFSISDIFTDKQLEVIKASFK